MVINNQTTVFEKENDPSVLRSPSAGKLLNQVVKDGSHVDAGDTYAEIEVMKMVMSLVAPISGTVYYLKRPGAILESGSTVARFFVCLLINLFKLKKMFVDWNLMMLLR